MAVPQLKHRIVRRMSGENEHPPPKRGLADCLLLLGSGMLVWAVPICLHLTYPFRHHESRLIARTAWGIEHELTTGGLGLTLYGLSLLAFALSFYRSRFRDSGAGRKQRIIAGVVSAAALLSLVAAGSQIVDAFSMLRTLLRQTV